MKFYLWTRRVLLLLNTQYTTQCLCNSIKRFRFLMHSEHYLECVLLSFLLCKCILFDCWCWKFVYWFLCFFQFGLFEMTDKLNRTGCCFFSFILFFYLYKQCILIWLMQFNAKDTQKHLFTSCKMFWLGELTQSKAENDVWKWFVSVMRRTFI